MKISNTIIFSLAVAFFIIGVYETIAIGISYSYWLFMVCFGLLFWYGYNKKQAADNDNNETVPKKKSKKVK